MSKEKNMRKFLHHCSLNNVKAVQELLLEHRDDIDIMEDDGQVFSICVSYNFIDLLNVLLDFYKETKLKDSQDSTEYKISYHSLQYVLEDAIEQYTPSHDIKLIIDRYISKNREEGSEAGDGDERLTEIVQFAEKHLDLHRDSAISTTDSDSTLELTADNLRQWDATHSKQGLIGRTMDLLSQDSF